MLIYNTFDTMPKSSVNPDYEAGLEPVDYSDLQVDISHLDGIEVSPSHLPQRIPGDQEEKHASSSSNSNDSAFRKPQARASLSRKLFWVIVILAVLAVIVIAVTVPEVEKRNSKSSQSPNSRGPTATTTSPAAGATSTSLPRILSKQGAFNGTGLTTLDPMNNVDNLFLFYQYHTGELQYATLSNQGDWQGGQSLGISHAMNGTPMAATSYSVGGLTTWQLFYVDDTGTIQNIYQTNSNPRWTNGDVGSRAYKVPEGNNVAFSLRYGVQWNATYGPFGGLDDGLILYAGGTDGLVHEYVYANNTWTMGYTFPESDGYAGASVSTQVGEVSTMHLVNSDGELELLYKDYNPNSSNLVWNRGADATVSLLANTSLCAAGNAFYQSPSGHIMRSEWTGYASTQRWSNTYDLSNTTVLEGTSIGCQFLYPPSPVAYYAFWQGNGTDIIGAQRPWANASAGTLGDWVIEEVPIG